MKIIGVSQADSCLSQKVDRWKENDNTDPITCIRINPTVATTYTMNKYWSGTAYMGRISYQGSYDTRRDTVLQEVEVGQVGLPHLVLLGGSREVGLNNVW